MLIIILSGYFLAGFAPLVFRIFKQASSWILALVPSLIFVYLLGFLQPILSGSTFLFEYNWVPSLDLTFSFYLDGLSLLFALLISGFGALIFIYSGSYLKGHQLIGRFYMFLLLFMASMLGVVLSGNLLGLFIFWELTSLSSYLLIGFNHETEESRKSALQAMLITVPGGLALLAGVILINLTTGTYDLPTLLQSSVAFKSLNFYQPIVVLLLLAALTKSAQFPFSFWLPNAMAAPTPVSAYLHSATMVKAGVYLVARFTPVLGDSPLWHTILITAGTITMVTGALQSLFQNDLKKILAYTTLSALGMLFMTLGIGSSLAIKAALTFLVAHAFYKCALFLIAGNIDKSAHSRDVNLLRGLFKKMPLTGLSAILSGLSMAAVLPVFGFLAKEQILEATQKAQYLPWLLTFCVIIAGVAFVIVGLIVGYQLLFKGPAKQKVEIKEASVAMLIGPLVLSLGSLLFGLFSSDFISPILNSGYKTIIKNQGTLELALWHGFTPTFLLSLLTIITGILLFNFKKKLAKAEVYFLPMKKYGPEEIYFHGQLLLQKSANMWTRIMQNGYLRSYITVILLVFVALAFWVVFSNNLLLTLSQNWQHSFDDLAIYEVLIAIVMLVAVSMLFLGKDRLTAIIALGIVGYGVALLFVFFGAPDLAITQFLIETLTVLLFVLILHRLPKFRSFKRYKSERVLVIVPVLFGSLMTFILLYITNEKFNTSLKEFFLKNGYLLGKGHNVVNVILVDFRALDTMGEITVLTIAAIGIYALLNLKLENKEIDK